MKTAERRTYTNADSMNPSRATPSADWTQEELLLVILTELSAIRRGIEILTDENLLDNPGLDQQTDEGG